MGTQVYSQPQSILHQECLLALKLEAILSSFTSLSYNLTNEPSRLSFLLFGLSITLFFSDSP